MRRRILLVGILVGASVVVGRAAQLQVVEGGRWRERAEDQHADRLVLPAPRGTIYDRNGVPLAASEESYRVALAPRELADRGGVASLLEQVLGLSAAEARRALDPGRRWVVLPGLHDAMARGRLAGEKGVYFEAVMRRSYPHGELARALLGAVSADGVAAGGVESELDSLLAGQPGVAIVRRDARGVSIPGALLDAVQPVPGADVYLTIDAGLEEIAEQAVRAAVDSTRAAGGEMILADPRTGEVLAAVTVRPDAPQGGAQWRAATDTYEPGSTFKPFFVATLLAEGRATLDDSVFAENGRAVIDGRTVQDVEKLGWITLRDGLRESSNICMVKFSSRVAPGDQFRYLRAFGFGSPTGVRYPSESSGVLRRPTAWSRYSQGSLAIGYEVGVTPLQMAMAYGAIANGGMLMEPRLVREVRSRDGRIVASFGPRAVRRVVAPAVAAQIRDILAQVVEGGTGTRAAVGPFPVAGKTGTARVFRGGRYEAGAYTSSFAGFFPARDPQLVFLVKLDRPQGAYYGGLAAAPVTRATLEAALAAWQTPLDRAAVARTAMPLPPESLAARARLAQATPVAAEVPVPEALPVPRPPVTGPFVFALARGAPLRPAPEPAAPRPVPAVAGLTLRDAARRLMAGGFRVQVEGSGLVTVSQPAAGAMAPSGTTVRLVASPAPAAAAGAGR
jgi:cell division protein FtsI (penicillin-binding protein 3)